MEIKLGCGCGQKYKFDVEPRNGRMPVQVACPVCGADGTEIANHYLAQQFPNPSPPIPVALRVHVPSPSATVAGLDEPPLMEEAAETAPAVLTGPRFCKFHPASPARYLCNKCSRTFCDLCINFTPAGGKTMRLCRGCGVEVVPFQFQQAAAKSFHSKLPGAFGYPFKGTGIIILICATIAFSALSFVGGGIFGIFTRIALYGFVFLFMQNIIQSTTSNENEPLGFPDPSGLFGAAFQLAGTVAASFWLALGLEIAKFNDVPVPPEAIIAAVIAGGVYFPMALLAVAMKDTVLAANPLIVIPAMLKAPLNYSITAVLTLLVFGIRQVGKIISGGAGAVSLRTHNQNVFFQAVAIQIGLALLSVYLLCVTMRILGIFYNSSKKQLGWYSS
jgi:hypothetical protein